jgi:hypothetical protein
MRLSWYAGAAAESRVRFLGEDRSFGSANLLEEEQSPGDLNVLRVKPWEIRTPRFALWGLAAKLHCFDIVRLQCQRWLAARRRIFFEQVGLPNRLILAQEKQRRASAPTLVLTKSTMLSIPGRQAPLPLSLVRRGGRRSQRRRMHYFPGAPSRTRLTAPAPGVLTKNLWPRIRYANAPMNNNVTMHETACPPRSNGTPAFRAATP